MARHPMPSASSRRLSKRRPAAVRIFAAAVLGTCVLLALAGLTTAVYLQRSPDTSPSVAAPSQAVATLPLPAPPPFAGAASDASTPPPNIPAESSANLPDLPPIAGSTAPPSSDLPAREGATLPPVPPQMAPAPAAAAAEPAPSPAAPVVSAAAEPFPPAATPSAPGDAPASALPSPAPAAAPLPNAEPQYWVEYAVYVGRHYAVRLQQSLAREGLDTVVVRTHTPAGRPLLRVRSARPSDHAMAERAAEIARHSVRIVALLHRLPNAAANGVARGPAPPVYWVRLGAFHERRNAAAARETLARHGIDTILYSAHRSSGNSLFYLRSVGDPDRVAAADLAAQARAVVAVGATVLRGPAHARRPARHAKGPSAPGGPPRRPTG